MSSGTYLPMPWFARNRTLIFHALTRTRLQWEKQILLTGTGSNIIGWSSTSHEISSRKVQPIPWDESPTSTETIAAYRGIEMRAATGVSLFDRGVSGCQGSSTEEVRHA